MYRSTRTAIRRQILPNSIASDAVPVCLALFVTFGLFTISSVELYEHFSMITLHNHVSNLIHIQQTLGTHCLDPD
jgi:hypothetical protein